MKVWIQDHIDAHLPIVLNPSPVASGGEGGLYAIKSPKTHQHLVAKIYHPKRRTELRYKKILYLQEHPPKALRKQLPITMVWPQKLLFDDNNQFIGFLMPWVEGEKLELLCLPQIPKKKLNQWKNFDFNADVRLKKRLDICYKIATGMQNIHDTERYILVDMKPDNIMVTPKGAIALVDLDSVEVVENGTTLYDAPVATPEYTPPDSYLKNNLVDPTQEEPWDRFGMAVIFYKMLLGIHPYAASSQAPYDQYTSLYQKIEHGLFVHNPNVRTKLAVVPQPHNRYKNLPSSIQKLFERCFIDGHHNPFARPSTEEWVETLRQYNANQLIDDEQIKIPPIALSLIINDLDLDRLFTIPTTMNISQAPKLKIAKPIEKNELKKRHLPISVQNPEEIRSQRFFNFIILLLTIVIGAVLSIIMPWFIAVFIGLVAYLGFNYTTYRTRKSAGRKDTILSILNKQMEYFNELIRTAEGYEQKIAQHINKLKKIQVKKPKEYITNHLKRRELLQSKINTFLMSIQEEKRKLKALRHTEKVRYQELQDYYQQQAEGTTTIAVDEPQSIRQQITLLKRKHRLQQLNEQQTPHYEQDLSTLKQLLIQKEIEQTDLEEQHWEKTQDIIYRCEKEHKQLLKDIDRYHQSVGKKEEETIKMFIEEQRMSLRDLEHLQYDLQQLEKPLDDQVEACRRAQQDAELYKRINYSRHLLEMVGLVKPF